MRYVRRLCEAVCWRNGKTKRYRGEEYILLRPCQDVELSDLETFLRENFSDLGIGCSDLTNFTKDSEVVRHLLRLLPVYKQCMSKYVFLTDFLENRCRPHMRPAAEIECQKSKRVLETLDVVMLKLVIGDFSLSENEGVDRLIEKFSTDQSTLLEIERLERLIDMDRQESKHLMNTEVADATRAEAIISRLSEIPAIPLEDPDSVAGTAISSEGPDKESKGVAVCVRA